MIEKTKLEQENLAYLKDQAEKNLTQDEIHIQRIKNTISSTKIENEEKDLEIRDSKEKVAELSNQFKQLSQFKDDLTHELEEKEKMRSISEEKQEGIGK